jgi:hypothetical protein
MLKDGEKRTFTEPVLVTVAFDSSSEWSFTGIIAMQAKDGHLWLFKSNGNEICISDKFFYYEVDVNG